MKVVPFLKRVAIFAALGLFCLSLRGTEPAPQRYNILFIAVDDLRTELNCYGATHVKSPHIDRLAESGVLFSNAYVQQSICMASRASLLSGVGPEKRGIYTGEAVADLMPGVLTLNKLFENNGYSIAAAGKIYHFGKDKKAQFGKRKLKPEPTWAGRGYVTDRAIEVMNSNSKSTHGPAYEIGEVDDDAYPDGANATLAVAQLAKFKQEGEPFFMAFGLLRPHLPFNAPKKYWDMYPEDSVPSPPVSERPKGSSKYTMRTGGELTNYMEMPASFAEIDTETERTLRRGYFASVSYADAQIGRVLDALEANDLADSTIVILWGDHGFKLGDFGSWCKWTNMDIDTRVPLIIRVPGGKQGLRSDRMVETLDIYPTLADLCGLEKPEHLDGESLVGILDNPEEEAKGPEYAYSIWPDNRWRYEKTVMGYSVKDGRFNYVEWVQLKTGEVLERELYDHAKDPRESVNAVDDPEYDKEIERLAAQLEITKMNTEHEHDFKQLR